ncbi:putative ribonuclease H-like domain-containing protein [Tanacetum coccineum]
MPYLYDFRGIGIAGSIGQTSNANSGILEMEPDIENITINEYLEYEAEKERRLWRNVQSKSSPTRYNGADSNSSHHDKSFTKLTAPANKSILGELLEEFEDEILNVTMVDEEADCNPTKDIEELERLIVKDPQSHFTKIQLNAILSFPLTSLPVTGSIVVPELTIIAIVLCLLLLGQIAPILRRLSTCFLNKSSIAGVTCFNGLSSIVISGLMISSVEAIKSRFVEMRIKKLQQVHLEANSLKGFTESRTGKKEESKALVTVDGESVDWTTHSEDDDNYAFMANNSSGSNTQVTSCSHECKESYANLKRLYDVQREELSDASVEIKAYTQGLKKVEAQLVAHQQGQLWYEQKIKFMKIDLDDKTDVLTYHKTLLAKAQKEKDDLEVIVNKWNHSSKNLGKIINYSMSARDKFGLGYGDYRYSGNLSYENEVFQSVFRCNESDFENVPLHKRIAKTGEMQAVPPPMTGNYLPSGPDIEIDDSQYTYGPEKTQPSEPESQTNEHDTCDSNISTEPSQLVSEPGVSESNVEVQPKVWSDAPIIEEYESDSDDECMTVQTKGLDTPREKVKNQSTNSQKPKVNNKELGNESNERACFVCGSFSHLIRDCDYHVKLAKQVELNKQNMSKGNSTGVRKPRWNNVQRDNPHRNLQNKGIIDSGCSRHMTGNKAYLADFQDYNGGPVAFGGSKGYITGKGKIKTGKLDFEDVSFVKELQPFNLLLVCVKMCGQKEQGGLGLFNCKATTDESISLWHRRGLPTKLFQNDHTCVACQKGKQHKASCKAKLVSSISHPLQLLHMDLFGPTSVRSINHKTYCLVITDDFSRFSWTFFLRTKDETSAILKDFIRQIENQLNQKVKIIRCDNGTEFKNRDVIEFCGLKGIKREYSNARTPQQNGVAERKNRTLIEAARTMLADSFLPNTFWAEAVSTACYVLNRVLVTKPHNKTPYELLTGKTPIISYIRPFGCHVTILNTIDHLGKFVGKSDEGFLVGYSLQSKTFRVYNLVTKRVEENLHIKFLENRPNVAGKGPNWLFDLDYLTDSMNYHYVSSENQANIHAGQQETNNTGTKDKIDAGDSEKEDESAQDCFKLPIWHSYSSTNPFVSKSNHKIGSPRDEEQVFLDDLARLQRQEKESNEEAEALRKNLEQETENLVTQAGAAKSSSTNIFSTVSTTAKASGTNFVNIVSIPVSTASAIERLSLSETTNSQEDDSEIPPIEDIHEDTTNGIFTHSSYDDEGAVADFTNMETVGFPRILSSLKSYKVVKALYGLHQASQSMSVLVSRFQVTPKTSLLSAVKRIFRIVFTREPTNHQGQSISVDNKWDAIPLESEVPNESLPDSSSAQPSEVPFKKQPDPSLRPSPRPSPQPSTTPIVPDSIPEPTGENLGDHSSNDISLSGNEDDMTLLNVYDLCISLCKQVSDQAKEIKILKAKIKKLKK